MPNRSTHWLPFDQVGRWMDIFPMTIGGLGLGLALVRGLLRMHYGEIEATSSGLGFGSTFTLRMTRRPALLPAWPENSVETPLERARTLNVLVIDDRRDAAFPISKTLQRAGHTVEVAEDGPTGIETAFRMLPDLVICDIGLPGISGYEVARQLRADDRTKHAKLVALTGYGQADDRRRAEEAGFDLHWIKPINLAELSAAVQAMCED